MTAHADVQTQCLPAGVMNARIQTNLISTGDFMNYSKYAIRRVVTLALAIVSLFGAPLDLALAVRPPVAPARELGAATISGSESGGPIESVPSLSAADQRDKARVSEAFGKLPL